MKIRLITAQNKVPAWTNQACELYFRRLQAYCQFSLLEIPSSKRTKNLSVPELQRIETARLLEKVSPAEYLIACHERGRRQTSQQLAQSMQKTQDTGQCIAIIIGGADGLDLNLLKQAKSLWSLSDFTFPQHLARVVLIEQLYRAFTLIHNHPYHRQ